MKVANLILTMLTIALIYTMIVLLFYPRIVLTTVEAPTSNLFWIDSDRFHKDSIITTSDIFDGNNEKIGEWIVVTYGNSKHFEECIDKEGYEWEEWKTSFIKAFKEGIK